MTIYKRKNYLLIKNVATNRFPLMSYKNVFNIPNYQQNMYQRILQQRFILITQMLLLQLLIISLYGVIFPPKVKAIEFDFENVKT